MAHPSDFLIYLVVHDDAVRDSICVLLNSMRFQVWGFKSADEFLCADREIAHSCIIIDEDMPDMSGSELLNRLRSENFVVPAISITTNNIRIEATGERADVIFLEKPYAPDKLIGCISKALASAKSKDNLRTGP